MPWGAIIGGAVSLISGANSKKSADRAADAQIQAAQQANQRLDEQAGMIRRDNAPFRDAGLASNERLQYLLGNTDPRGTPIYEDAPKRPDAIARGNQVYRTTGEYLGRYGIDPGVETIGKLAPQLSVGRVLDDQGNVLWEGPQQERKIIGYTPNDSKYEELTRDFTQEDIQKDPVYESGLQFGLDEGKKAINARAIASGSYDSGATLKALTRFAEDYGSTKAGDAYSRFMGNRGSIYGMLTGQQAVGQNATNATNNATTALTTGATNNMTDAGNARAAGIVGGANAWGNAASGVNQAYGNYQNNEILKKLMNPGGASSYSSLYNTAYGPTGYNWG